MVNHFSNFRRRTQLDVLGGAYALGLAQATLALFLVIGPRSAAEAQRYDAELAEETSANQSGRMRSILGGSAELFGTHTIDRVNREDNLFGFGIGGSLYLEVNPLDLIGIQVGGTAMWLSADDSEESSQWLGLAAGPRFHLATLWESRDDFWIDAHWVFGRSGSIARHGFDIGIGYEFALSKSGFWRLGPMFRYMWASDPGQERNPDGTVVNRDRNNPQWLIFGVSLGIGGARDRGDDEDDRRPPPPSDLDGDGIPDDEDMCPTVHQGDRPDPNRPGCPDMSPLDTDGDGVPDTEDMCPTVPAGPTPDPTRPGCPAGDRDGDGVPDHEDMCPDTPMGPRPDPNRPGCPIPDRDGDMVPDDVDACPDEPGAPSTDPRKHGCPGLVRVQDGQIRINRPVYFAFNKDRILSNSNPVLRAVADAILASSDVICGIRVEGHTDSQGLESYNYDLSERRAKNVAKALTRYRVDRDKLESKGFGPSRPVETNETTEGRAANRRVEFHITEWCSGDGGLGGTYSEDAGSRFY